MYGMFTYIWHIFMVNWCFITKNDIYTLNLQGVPLSNHLQFKHHVLEGAGIVHIHFVFFDLT